MHYGVSHLHLYEVFVVFVLAEHHLLHIFGQVIKKVAINTAQLMYKTITD